MEKSRKLSKRQEMCKEGTFGIFYTQKGYFCRISQCFNIDKVKFSFVKMNTNGKGFDIYMSVDKFDNWADDIISGNMNKKIKAALDSGKAFAVADKFITGENGEKEINVSPSKIAGCVMLQGTIDRKEWARVPVPYEELKDACKWFKRASVSYFESLTKEILEAKVYVKDTDVSEDKTTSVEEPDIEPEVKSTPKVETERFKFTTKSAAVFNEADNTYSVDVAVEGFKQTGKLIFDSDLANKKIKGFDKFVALTKTEAKHIGCNCVRKGGTFTFVSL